MFSLWVFDRTTTMPLNERLLLLLLLTNSLLVRYFGSRRPQVGVANSSVTFKSTRGLAAQLVQPSAPDTCEPPMLV